MGPNCCDNNVLSVLKLRQVVSCIWCTGTFSKHMNSYRLWHAHIISQDFTCAVDLWLVASRVKSTGSVCLNVRSPVSKDTAYPHIHERLLTPPSEQHSRCFHRLGCATCMYKLMHKDVHLTCPIHFLLWLYNCILWVSNWWYFTSFSWNQL